MLHGCIISVILVLSPATKGADYLSAIDFAEFPTLRAHTARPITIPTQRPHACPDTNNSSRCPGGRLRAFFKTDSLCLSSGIHPSGSCAGWYQSSGACAELTLETGLLSIQGKQIDMLEIVWLRRNVIQHQSRTRIGTPTNRSHSPRFWPPCLRESMMLERPPMRRPDHF
jgi:hypothetical protein